MMYKNQEGYADPTAGQALANIRREEKARLGYMPLVYICSPFRGNVENNMTFDHIATARNGWNAIVINGQVGWVSGKYSKVI